MRKRIWLSVSLVFLMLCLLSVGCRQENTSPATGNTAVSTYVTEASPTVSESTEPSESEETQQPSTYPSSEPTELPTEVTTEPPTDPPTEASAEPPTEPPTQPPTEPENGDEFIGSLYTRNDLYNMNTTNYGYGPGSSAGGKRPPYAQNLERQFSDKYNAHFIAPDNGKVYLTFSLGYEYNNLTAKILDVLQEKEVKGVFFISLHYAKANQDLVRRIIDEGHILANHTSNHYTLAELSIDRVVNEIMRLHEYVLDTYGYEM